MKILFMNSTDCRGGAAKAAVRILNAVQHAGVDASLLSQEQGLNGAESSCYEKFCLWVRPRLDSLPTLRYRKRTGMIFSPSRLSDRIAESIDKLSPDIIHLHWIQEGFIRVETLSDLKIPIVWTMHDSWPFTGGCHLPYDCDRFLASCGSCPVLASSNEYDLSRDVWMRKCKAWENVPFTIVSPSRWLAGKAAESSLFRHKRIVVIPNCIDISIYHKQSREMVRKEFGIEPDELVIIINASQMAVDSNKGEALLGKILYAVAQFPDAAAIHLLVIGSNFSKSMIPQGIRASYAGQIGDEKRMSELYSSADLLVVTSHMENLSNTVMEAMACAVPSVVFNVGGMSELINDGENGRLIAPFEIDEFVEAVWWCLDAERLPELSHNAVKIAGLRYTSDKVAEQYLELYNTLDV